jgi:hypothetical protein
MSVRKDFRMEKSILVDSELSPLRLSFVDDNTDVNCPSYLFASFSHPAMLRIGIPQEKTLRECQLASGHKSTAAQI